MYKEGYSYGLFDIIHIRQIFCLLMVKYIHINLQTKMFCAFYMNNFKLSRTKFTIIKLNLPDNYKKELRNLNFAIAKSE